MLATTGVLRGHEAAPIVANGTMYVVTPHPNILYALDLARGGALKWKYEPGTARAAKGVACCDVVNRGAAYADGRVFFNTLDVHTVAVDAASGKELQFFSLHHRRGTRQILACTETAPSHHVDTQCLQQFGGCDGALHALGITSTDCSPSGSVDSGSGGGMVSPVAQCQSSRKTRAQLVAAGPFTCTWVSRQRPKRA